MEDIKKMQCLLYTLAVIVSTFSVQLSRARPHNGGGFTVDLIPRDSPRSPFYNPSETKFDRLRNSFRRSISRYSGVSTKEIESTVIANSGSFLMNISFGTPPVPMLGIVDTGSDLIWRQCEPCVNCYEQKEPIFDPSKSSTYDTLSCSNQFCDALESAGSCSSGNICQYTYQYGDGSYTTGDLAADTLTVDSTSGGTVSVPKIALGCGNDNQGTFDENGSGLIGLGRGPLSMIAQLRSSIGARFSYCLVPADSDPSVSSKLNFGSNAVVSGSGTVSTPLYEIGETFYYVTLEGFSVGNERLDYKPSINPTAETEGNIIVDSGTTLTILPESFYSDLRSSIVKAVGRSPVTDPSGTLDLCFDQVNDLNIPIITAHFTGADVELQPVNTFALLQEDLACFTFTTASNLAIFGNFAQINFLVGYDLKSNKLFFKPTDCTK